MKTTSDIVIELGANAAVMEFLSSCKDAWSNQVDFGEANDWTSEELDFLGSYPEKDSIVQEIEKITELGDLSAFGNDFFALIYDCVVTFGPDSKDLELIWETDVKEWVDDVHEEKPAVTHATLTINDVSIDLTSHLSSLSVCCEAGLEWAEKELQGMSDGDIKHDRDELWACEDIVSTAKLIDKLVLNVLSGDDWYENSVYKSIVKMIKDHKED